MLERFLFFCNGATSMIEPVGQQRSHYSGFNSFINPLDTADKKGISQSPTFPLELALLLTPGPSSKKLPR